MLNFHFCQKYINKVPQEADKAIRNRIANLKMRTTFKDLPKILSSNGVSVLQTNNPTQMRTIIQEKKVLIDEVETLVYFVQDIVFYEDFSQPYTEIKKGLWASYYPIAKEDEDNCIAEIQKEQTKKTGELLPIPDRLVKWLSEYKMNVTYDIYESEEWVEFAISNGLDDGMRNEDIASYNYALQEMIKETSSDRETLKTVDNTHIEAQKFQNFVIVYSKIFLPNQPEPSFLLHNGAHLNRQKARWLEIKQEATKKQDVYNNIDDIGRKAVRAYPSWTLKHDELWGGIQKNSESGNLSLLTEQTEFLNEKFRFPAYINGQAGSGKSTMLYYLFANTYYYKCVGMIDENIIFLTENEKLLASTKKSIIELLQHNPEFNLSSDDITNVDNHFYTLKDFLLSLLEEDSDRIRFPDNKYLDFSEFKTQYEQATHFSKRIRDKYTPEFAWFTITTYIMGYNFDLSKSITSENYDKEMPRDGKLLLFKDELKDIEKNILPFYKKLIEVENYWDKLKIIRYITEEVGVNKLFEVIFCDEAQDFSRVELKFILGLSEYLKYDLTSSNSQIRVPIPIVFAGDPLQTVNPTGFRKEEVKDLFYQELEVILKDNEYKPKHNYRSSQAIVNMANAVQYFRKKVFYASVPSPQQTKHPDAIKDAYFNIFISYELIEDNQEYYIEQLQHKTFIVPVNSNEKNGYVNSKEHDFLNKFISSYAAKEDLNGDGENINEDILKSSVEAKGIDYPQVVIYGFGTYCLDTFGSYERLIDNNSYSIHFFFNKLYVAITRAREELIIIDRKDTLELFWQPLLEAYSNSEWQPESNVSTEAIRKTICRIDQGFKIRKGTPDMALANANRDKQQAKQDSNPTLLRMAAAQFLRLGIKKEYFICRALEAKLEGDYLKAADFYKKKDVGNEGLELAASTYWEAKLLDELQKLGNSLKSENQNLRLIIANLYFTGEISPKDIRFLDTKRFILEELLRKISWRDEIIIKFIGLSQKVNEKEQRVLLLNILAEINNPSNAKLTYEIGRLQYKLGRYSEAIETWLQVNDRDIDSDILYIHAQAEKAKQEEKFDKYIEFLGKLSENYNSDAEREKAERIIITTFEGHKAEVTNSTNLYAHIYVCGAYLLHKPNSLLLLELAQRAEEKAKDRKEFLTDYYKYLLESKRLPSSLFDFVLERWAKYQYLSDKKIDSVNQFYKVVASSNGLTYIPFTVEDLTNITQLPSYIIPTLSNHIKSVTIKSFRKFNDVTIENMGLFNLVVGDNNIGKTSLLEAFLFTPEKKEYLQRLAFAYIERRNIQPDSKKEVNGLSQFIYLMDKTFLNDFKSYNNTEFKLEFAFKQKRHSWHYQILEELSKKDSSIQYLKFDEDDFKILNSITLMDAMKNPLMPYGKGFGMDLAAVYEDVINNIPAERDFIKRLELFIPNIERIRTSSRKGEIDILEKGSDSYISLHQYGDGANKIFRILLLLSLHKGKRLMIDEIDAGIHYSRFKQFWKIILEVAKQDGTQIIASTHNDECITYYTDAIKELEEKEEGYGKEARVVQCKNVGNKLKIYSFDFENFNLAQERGIELRGGQKT
jgi:AAA15 family ATPase/GTPase